MTATFVSPSPGSWTAADRYQSNHEAAHALMALLLDVPIIEVRIDRPDADTLGWLVRAGLRGKVQWKGIAIALAPAVVERRCPTFPSSKATDSDELRAAELIRDLRLGPEDYQWIVGVAEGLLGIPSSRRALTAIAGALLERGVLSGDEVRRVVEGEN
jgi:hypothetical protein